MATIRLLVETLGEMINVDKYDVTLTTLAGEHTQQFETDTVIQAVFIAGAQCGLSVLDNARIGDVIHAMGVSLTGVFEGIKEQVLLGGEDSVSWCMPS